MTFNPHTMKHKWTEKRSPDADESAETLLPVIGARIPCPPGQLAQSASAIGAEGSSVVLNASKYDPRTEPVAIDRV